MQFSNHNKEKRGSALLIVLGLLGFLMISAVAFSISMRSEYKAAAAYRKSVIARDLITVAFSDAQNAVEYAFKQQALDAGVSASSSLEEIRQRAYLCPFKSEGEDKYGRLIASSDGDSDASNASDIAYLLDDRAMRHVPPYVANMVFHTLERADSRQDILNAYGNNRIYSINDYARWRPVKIKRPTIEAENYGGNTESMIKDATIGRMAWAVINLSDTLDINGIGSAHNKRGLGFTGSEYAFLSGGTGDDGLFETDADFSNFTFYSNADIAQYVARSNAFTNFAGESTDGAFPYSWAYAASSDGEGLMYDEKAESILSPFSVYSFWPAVSSRTTENKTISLTALNDAFQGGYDSFTSELGQVLKNNPLFTNQEVIDNYARLLYDYLDEDDLPGNEGAGEGNYALPNVENVPMVSEVIYRPTNNTENGLEWKLKNEKDLKTDLAVDNDDMPKNNGTIPLSKLGLTDELVIEIPTEDILSNIQLGAYFPGYEASTSDYTLYAEGYIALTPQTSAGEDNKLKVENFLKNNDEVKVTTFTVAGANISIAEGDAPIFRTDDETIKIKSSDIFTNSKIELKLDPSKMNVTLPAEGGTTATTFNIDFVVQTLFNVKIKAGSEIVDSTPAMGGFGSLDDMEGTIKSGILNSTTGMYPIDQRFFRITRAFNATFTLALTGAGSDEGQVLFMSDLKEKLQARAYDASDSLNVKNKEYKEANASHSRLSPKEGSWLAIDPRYNWISPMLGIAGNGGEAFSDYFGSGTVSNTGSILAQYSSPHWVFIDGIENTSGINSAMEAYQNTHAERIIPFKWGLEVADIRYEHNNSEQFVFPAELALVPVPKMNQDWIVNHQSYQTMKPNDYYQKVARESFYRTLPIVDFGDAATSSYADYAKVIPCVTSRTDIPEEHRSIMSAYAGQDDYTLSLRLRKLALRGIPNSIQDAIAISKARIAEAKSAEKINSEFASKFEQDFSHIEDVTELDIKGSSGKDALDASVSKFDNFINNYLLKIPSTGNIDWPANETRPENALDPLGLNLATNPDDDSTASNQSNFINKISDYNQSAASNARLGQNDITSLVGYSQACFGDRQQLFLYIMRVDTLTAGNAINLVTATIGSTTRAVALVWRDAYGELPSRVIYFQML